MRRIYEHKNKLVEGFTKKYNIHRLVWHEIHESAESAIRREKQIKKWKRAWKIELVEKSNPQWNDLWAPLKTPVVILSAAKDPVETRKIGILRFAQNDRPMDS